MVDKVQREKNEIMHIVGFILTILALWFLFDSVRVSTNGHGLLSGLLHGQFRGGTLETASMGLIFVPFILGIIALFWSAAQKWAWLLTWTGVSIIVVEMLSRIRFLMNVKSSYLILVMVLFASGIGLMLRASKGGPNDTEDKEE